MGIVSQEIKTRIETLIDNHSDPGYVTIDSMLDVSIHFDTSGVSVTDYASEIHETYSPSELYYYGSYTDNHSQAYWFMTIMDGSYLDAHFSENDVVSVIRLPQSTESFENEVPNIKERMHLFFTEVDYQKVDETQYKISVPYSIFLEEDEEDEFPFKSYDPFSPDEVLIDLEYNFTENSIRFTMDVTYLLDRVDVQRVTLHYETMMMFPESISYFEYNMDDYYVESSPSIDSVGQVFTTENDVRLYLERGRDNVVAYELEPGYYNFIPDKPTDSLPYMEDSKGNILKLKPFFKIEEKGVYYLYLNPSYSDKNIIRTIQILESDLKNDPSLNTFEGDITGTTVKYHFLNMDSDAGVLKITANVITNRSVCLVYNQLNYCFGEGTVKYMLIPPGYDPIVYSNSTYQNHYRFSYEVVPYTAYTEELSEMISLDICSDAACINKMRATPNLFLGGENPSTYVKFEILSSGKYYFVPNPLIVSKEEDNFTLPPSNPLYDANGNIVYQNFMIHTSVILEPGIYYTRIDWFEGYNAIFGAYINKR